jgi:hypothetical protein
MYDLRLSYSPEFKSEGVYLEAFCNQEMGTIERGYLIIPRKQVFSMFDVFVSKIIALIELEYGKTKESPVEVCYS